VGETVLGGCFWARIEAVSAKAMMAARVFFFMSMVEFT
jgi:hypothetical protein